MREHRSFSASPSKPILPYVFCVDVGSPKNVGWADHQGNVGSGETLGPALTFLGERLHGGQQVALGFEAPIWTPRRSDFMRLTSSRDGAERRTNRAWSAGPGCGVLATALALMPWCFAEVLKRSGMISATTLVNRFTNGASRLLIWEALVTGKAKGLSHQEDATLAVEIFQSRYPHLNSDVPPEPAVNHAAIALHIAGFNVRLDEMKEAALILCVEAK